MAEHFEMTYVDVLGESGMNHDTYHAYSRDASCTHPNAGGHYLMTKQIMKTMLGKK